MSDPRRREPWEFNPDGPPVSNTPGDRSVFDRPRREPWEIIPNPLHTELRDEERPLGTSEFERRYPNRLDRWLAGLRNIGQGVPGFGHLLETTPASRDFGRTYPLTSGLGRFGLGTAMYLPGAHLARGTTNAIANAIRMSIGNGQRRTHAGLIADTLGQGVYGGFVAAGDASLQDPSSDTQSILGNALLGFGTSAAGNIGSRLLAPSGVGNRFRVDRHTNSIMPDPEHMPILNALSRDPRFLNSLAEFRRATQARALGINPPRGAPTERDIIRQMNRFRGAMLAEQTANRIEGWVPRVLGAYAGHYFGGLPGAILGLGGSDAVRGAIRAYGRQNIGRSHLGTQFTPLTQSGINAGVISGLSNSTRTDTPNQELINSILGIR